MEISCRALLQGIILAALQVGQP